MKNIIRILVPYLFVDIYRYVRRRAIEYSDKKRGVEEVFVDIYQKNRWGGKRGEINSGSGSDDIVASLYIDTLAEFAESEGFRGLTFVDLGCGDFRIGKKILPLCQKYIGVDIVDAVIQRNVELYGNDAVIFLKQDIIDSELPDGDVCTVRQVLQHLSNDQILQILGKIGKYKWVFITEHYPSDDANPIPNIDKVHGGGIRLDRNSGVYLSEPPFTIRAGNLEKVLEVCLPPRGDGKDAGVIRTYLCRPEAN
jgi:SAM-dependent methyltransferase